jgi:hypothetical protein
MRIVALPYLRPEIGPMLAGKLDGKRMFLRILEALPALNEPTLVIANFKGVDVATSSFLTEGVLRLRDHLRLDRSPAYLVVANMTEKVSEELNDLLARSKDAMIACDLSATGEVNNPVLLGALEAKLGETFRLLKQKGSASAIELHGENDDDAIGPTAWNNRLNTLASKSLVMEVQDGRTKKYKPLLEVT